MSIEDDITFLSRVPTLRVLGLDAVRILAIGAESRYLHPGEILFNYGDPSDGGYVVQSGKVKLTSSRSEGSNEVVAGPGALLGEFALLVETRRPGTAMAMEASTVLRISRSLFLKTMEGFPDSALKLRSAMASRAAEAITDLSIVRRKMDIKAASD